MNAAAVPGAPPPSLGGTRWALLFGNFVIGCGVMVVAGSLNDLVRSLQVGVAVAGQLITVAAVVMAIGAPTLAALVGRFDRRRLLTFALAWYAIGHCLSALAPGYAWLVPVRAISMLAAALFTPQAAAAVGWLAPPAARGRAITFVFLGWSLASVLGMPMHAYIGETLGWRYAFGLVALLSLAAAAWVWRAMPDGVRPPPLGLRAWREVFTQPVLMAIVAVTALSGAGQFTLFTYFAPFARQVHDASAAQISGLFGVFGAFGVAGNVWVSRSIDRIGASRAVGIALAGIALSLALWPLSGSMATMMLVLIPWSLGCFASNSAQQARLGTVAPALAPALMALNTSAIYLGQAIGAASGGAMVAAHAGASGREAFGPIHLLGLAWLLGAIGLSAWAARQQRLRPLHA